MSSAGAPFGNQNNKKLDTPELRAKAYAQYCAHIASGKSKRSWCFEHPNLTLTWETMEKYIKSDNIEFDPDTKKIAESKGFAVWEGTLEGCAKGHNKEANVAALQMIMRNKFGWDRRDTSSEEDQSGSLIQTHDLLMAQLTRKQEESDPLQLPAL